MNKKIKAMIFDMDGTLIDKDSKMYKPTLDALKKAKEKGYFLILNSGRPIHLSQYIVDQYFEKDFFDYIYGCNGLESLNTKTHEYELLASLSLEDIQAIAKDYDYNEMTLLVYEGFDVLVNKMDDDPAILKWLNDRNLKRALADFGQDETLSKKVKRNYPKVVGIINEKYHDEIYKRIKDIDHPAYSVQFSSPCVVEFIPKGITKEDACLSVCKHLDIQMDEILSFGDTDNDRPMLQKTVGVVMANGSDDLKRDILYHTDRVDKEGIREFLYKYDFIEKN